MAITAPTVTGDFDSGFLPAEQAAPIFEGAARQSVAMRLIPQEPLGASGKIIPIWTSRPVAYWATEGGEKGKTKGAIDKVNLTPKKLTAIAVMSKEVVRANPAQYATSLRDKIAEAFAVAFDYAVFHDLAGDGTGTGPFAAALADTTHEVTFGTADTIYLDLVAGLTDLVDDGRKLKAFAFDDVAEPVFLTSVDANKRPLLQPTTAEGVHASLIGRPMLLETGVGSDTIAGFGGDFSKAAWGVVGGIDYAVSTEATVTIDGSLVSLFENNLVAVLAEAEYAFAVSAVAEFVKYNYAAVS